VITETTCNNFEGKHCSGRHKMEPQAGGKDLLLAYCTLGEAALGQTISPRRCAGETWGLSVATISLSSLFVVGQRVARRCRAASAFVSPSLRKGSSLLSSAFRPLMTVVLADYRRIGSSAIRTLSDIRPRLLLCLAFNILFVAGGAVLCVSGYGLAAGLIIVVLALAPVLMLLNIALFAGMDGGRRSLGAMPTTTQTSQRKETLDEKFPSIVPARSETAILRNFETALDEKGEPQDKRENRNPKGENAPSAQTQHETLIETAKQRVEPRSEVHSIRASGRPAVKRGARKPATR